MAISKDNPSNSSQLKGLMDLLVDLQILNSPQESSEPSSPLNGNGASQDKQEAEQAGGEIFGQRLVETSLPDAEKSSDSPKEAAPSDRIFDAPLVEESQELQLNPSPKLEAESNEPENHHWPTLSTPSTSKRSITDSAISNPAKTDATAAPSEVTLEQPVETKNGKEVWEAQRSLSFSPSSNLTSPPHPETARNEETESQPIRSPEKPQQKESLEGSSEQVLNRLIKSQWQNAQAQELKHQGSSSIDDKKIENSLELYERWQRLLLTQEVMGSRELLATLKQNLESLEHQVYEPDRLINLLLPLTAEVLSLKVAESGEDVAEAIAPLTDKMIQRRTQQDKQAMSSALAPLLPEAITRGVSHSPGEFAKALGPEIGPAIKEQINLERDAMVDALYPVIGSTISKYMAEVIHSINQKVENAFSVEGLTRKIRAKMQGVSEAELIFKESMPFTVQAVFLIHKGSGLVISEVQPSDRQRLESEMVAGMLTAIRSFVNDCIAQSGDVSEIDQIDYGKSKIILEVAGYCYLAAVIQGEPPKSFARERRLALSKIVQHHGKAIELFDGDPSNVPEPVNSILHDLTTLSEDPTEQEKRQPPIALIAIASVLLGAITIPLAIYHHVSTIDRRREEEVGLALASDPQLAIYRLDVDSRLGTLKLSGRLPNQYLRSRAEQITRKVEPKIKVYNAIVPVELPPDPVLATAEVKRVTKLLNKIEGAIIRAEYSEGNVTVRGTVVQESDAKKVTQAFEQIPGVKSVTSTVQLQPLAIASRVYFDKGSAELQAEERSKIAAMVELLQQYPNKNLKLLGHTDPTGTSVENEPLAVERATAVKKFMISQGIESKRLVVEGTTEAPLGVDGDQLPLLSRCVEFEIIAP
ncbi:MAG TPA: BON domain-containing protein [Allocoleopsis sp.]